MTQPNPHAFFAQKFERITETGCWLWMAALIGPNAGNPNAYEYGRFTMNGRRLLAHRASWELHFGAIPRGLKVCHSCDVSLCVNPAHLFLGTQIENMWDAVAKGRIASGERVHRARLTQADVAAIRASGERSVDLARRYSIDSGQISRIRHGKAWR